MDEGDLDFNILYRRMEDCGATIGAAEVLTRMPGVTEYGRLGMAVCLFFPDFPLFCVFFRKVFLYSLN